MDSTIYLHSNYIRKSFIFIKSREILQVLRTITQPTISLSKSLRLKEESKNANIKKGTTLI